MRCILTGCVGLALGWTAVGFAHEPMSQAGSMPDGRKPVVTLGPPTVALGAPRAVPGPVEFIAPCAYGVVARGKADEKAPLPPGPALPLAQTNTPAPPAGSTPLSPPTPLTPAYPPPAGGVISGPVTSGPITGDVVVHDGAMPGAPCATCNPGDPGWAPLPGGVFVGDSRPCGYIFYASAEYLLWWIHDAQLPPLLSTANFNPATGVLGPNNGVVFGGDEITPQTRSGLRVTLGAWLNECQNWGVIGSFFFLGSRDSEFAATANGTTFLTRPFLNVNPALGGLPVVSREIIPLGAFTAESSNNLWGADINLRKNIWSGCRGRLDWLFGFRYLRFDEDITMTEAFRGLPGTANAGRSGMLTDRFETNNDFYGGQVGLMGELRRGPWSLETTAKVALGNLHQSVTATGSQMGINEFGQVVSGPGLLVQPSNAGTRTRDTFAVLPEVTMNVGYQVTQHMKLFVGYNFLYCSNILRAGDQIDTTLDVNAASFPITQRPGATRPAPRFEDSNFWAQGINFGLHFTW